MTVKKVAAQPNIRVWVDGDEIDWYIMLLLILLEKQASLPPGDQK